MKKHLIVIGIILLIIIYTFAWFTGSILSIIYKDQMILKYLPIPTTFTFYSSLIALIFTHYFISKKDKIFGGEIYRLNNKALDLYYSSIFRLFGIIFTGFILTITLLWIKNRAGDNILILQLQSLLMLSIFLYVALSLYLTIISEFRDEFWKRNNKKDIENLSEVKDYKIKLLKLIIEKGEITKKEYEKMKKDLED